MLPVQRYHLTNVMGFIGEPMDERKIAVRYLEYVQRHLKFGLKN